MRWRGGGLERSVASVCSDRGSSALVAVATTPTAAAAACENVSANDVLFYTANAANVLSSGVSLG